MPGTLAEFKDLHTYFYTEQGIVKSVNGVSFRIGEGETVALVGESGCGKSVTALSMMGLIEQPAGRIVGGEIIFDGENLLRDGGKPVHRLRGHEIAMIFQEPMSSLNPVLTIGEQLMEPLMEHLHLRKKEARAEAVEWIRKVGVPRAEQLVDAYPHELSGGMLQRIMIAIALCCRPKLLIADEPTTALDVTIQAQILDLLRTLRVETGMSILLITHDLGVVAEMADQVIVMYGGQVIEQAPVLPLFRNPQHPYTQGLLKSRPRLGQRVDRLYAIPGQVPSPIGLASICRFSDRCEYAMEICRTREPENRNTEKDHSVACWLYEEGSDIVRSVGASQRA
ncbi:ABC transporter ATP-binding protein [Paenibacillus chondroitinus]|uniref:ABC transporter ATP-binding protein n=1 Tax=Paenibacillus chondroitinus TaxID=59842 RepID=A0ABU6D9N7_9BACL|nr:MULTISPECIES: ABC transporter ATP-binding protein [Paenibacillus]MCY9656542.1 ABC transporter ATP-binding protein [Paenibacillus anseongense]MEB4794191.1 ABC transporter ATP-binding protein [Paenibacillus chondroitinus]